MAGDREQPTGPRVYGQADDSKQHGTSNGMRGESASDPDPEGGFERRETLDGGRTVTVREESGTAHVEARDGGAG